MISLVQQQGGEAIINFGSTSAPGGVENDWGQIKVWEPPHHLDYTWYRGTDPEQPTRVEVRFAAFRRLDSKRASVIIKALFVFLAARFIMSRYNKVLSPVFAI